MAPMYSYIIDHTSELRWMVAEVAPMVADVGVFQVANVPTNWYVYSIPSIIGLCLDQKNNLCCSLLKFSMVSDSY